MAGSTCGANFSINVSIVQRCSLRLHNSDPIDAPSKTPDGAGATTPFSKTFSYIMGIDPNPTNTAYGFSLRAVGAPPGVSLDNVKYGHNVPVYDGAGAVQENTVSGDIVVADTYTSDVERDFNLQLQLNTG